MNILGINSNHADSSACIISNGKILGFSEEERYNRIKHSNIFPSNAIKYCLSKIPDSDKIDQICINTDPYSNITKKISYLINSRPNLGFVTKRIKEKFSKVGIRKELEKIIGKNRLNPKIFYVEHHLSHLASSYYTSPFNSSLGISIDGFGDFSSTAIAECSENYINIKKRIFFPYSMGLFYQAITQYLGFPHYGDEYKVMGLSPYGEPKYFKKILSIFNKTDNGLFSYDLKYFTHHKRDLMIEDFNNMKDIFDNDLILDLLNIEKRDPDSKIDQNHMDIAASAQKVYEDIFFHILNCAYKSSPNENLILSGGCALNSVANGKIKNNTYFKNIFIPPFPSDAGASIGAALYFNNKNINKKNIYNNNLAYLGDSFTNKEILKVLDKNKNKLIKNNILISEINDENQLYDMTCEDLIKGKIIGWFQGSMECGARALGNRSILADPSNKNMKSIINSKIKKRESFRPFAPSILEKCLHDWFDDHTLSPYMNIVTKIKENKKHLVPSVVHVDQTCRIQTVTEDLNGRYYKLINLFNEKTSIPMLLNTSFNENEPIVRTPEEALSTFLRTDIDILVLNDFYLCRKT